jgi:nitroreductase
MKTPTVADVSAGLLSPGAGHRSLEALLRTRHSCRAFLDRPVSRETIQKILELAQLTASWCNAQPWQVHIATGEALARFRDALLMASDEPPLPDIPYPQAYPGVYLERRRDCGQRLYDSIGIARGDRAGAARQARENFRMFGAPHVAVVTSPTALGVYATVDCGAYVSNFMLAAQSLGVATIAQAAQASYPDIARRHLRIGDDRTVVCGIAFGYEDRNHPANAFRTSRASISETVSWLEDKQAPAGDGNG